MEEYRLWKNNVCIKEFAVPDDVAATREFTAATDDVLSGCEMTNIIVRLERQQGDEWVEIDRASVTTTRLGR